MDEKKDLLFEIGCAELPAKGLNELSLNLSKSMENVLKNAQLTFGEMKSFATPRRLALLIKGLIAKQPDRQIEKRGPAINAPQAAKEGFARSCQVNIDQLQKLETPQGSWLIHRYVEPGKNTVELLPQLIQQALKELILPKSMRWGNGEYTFIRPVQWFVLLFGKDIVDAEIFGVKTGNKTVGHRFHHPAAITINDPNNYETILEKEGKVVADFPKRKKIMMEKINEILKSNNCKLLIDHKTLSALHDTLQLQDEVTGLVEWPVALLGSFDQRFLNLPKEALICSLQHHQKTFPVIGPDGELKPHFITVSNIESKDVAQVIEGNKRVIQARLSDAEFFYETDKKRTMNDYLNDLNKVIFQQKLGSLYDKSQRVARLAEYIAGNLSDDPKLAELAKKAGLLCKADLMTSMVGEFPELQGIMGSYYMLVENIENKDIAETIRGHYLPRYPGEPLIFQSLLSCIVGLADRFDTIVGLFGINKQPTGDKDPYALRRAAIGILQIVDQGFKSHNIKTSKTLDINFFEIIQWAASGFQPALPNENVCEQVHEFILERLRAQYIYNGSPADSVSAVLAVENFHPVDIQNRLVAVELFRKLPEAKELSEANKRAKNILEKSAVNKDIFSPNVIYKVNNDIFEKNEEQIVYHMIKGKTTLNSREKLTAEKYTECLHSLAELYKPVNNFFDAVMVNVEDEKIRNNRLLLVAAMRQLFLQVADISLLQI